MLEIEQVGMLASVVDQGRQHSQAQGYSQSGALDWVSFEYANAILGQALSNPAIEVFGASFTCRFKQACIVCITGADANLFVDSVQIQLATPVLVKQGQQLSINGLNSGLVNYIAFKGQLDIPEFGNSVCAVTREGSGGIYANGQTLSKGDAIKGKPDKLSVSCLGAQDVRRTNKLTIEPSDYLKQLFEQYSCQKKSINIALCYQAELFSSRQISQFTYHSYRISNSTDRMGMRLQGTEIKCAKNVLASQPIVYGAVQMTGEGMPIIMRNDRQTIGGYPIIGVVDKISMAILGQSIPGQSLKFTVTDFEKSRQNSLFVRIELEKISTMQARLFTL